MEVRNCKQCGKIYNYYYGHGFCPSCEAKMEDMFKKVKEYIYDNPRATIPQVADEFDISPNMIRNWVRDERLSFTEESAVGIECESCGKMIRTGRYCEECKRNLARGLQDAYTIKKKEKEETSQEWINPKMRFF